MILDLLKTKELSAIAQQLLKTNKGLVDTLLSSSQTALQKGIECNRSVLHSSLNTITTGREQANSLTKQIFEQAKNLEKRTLDTINSTSDQTLKNVDQLFERIGNPSEPVVVAIDDSILNSVSKISEPAINALKTATNKITEIPNNVVKQALKTGTENVKAIKDKIQPAVKSVSVKSENVESLAVKEEKVAETKFVATPPSALKKSIAKSKPQVAANTETKTVKAVPVSKKQVSAKSENKAVKPAVKTQAAPKVAKPVVAKKKPTTKK